MRVFSKLTPLDVGRLRDHLLRLQPTDRVMRFSGHVSDDFIAEHCRKLDWLTAVVVGWFEDGELRGAAEIRFEHPGAERAEVAVTVEGPWQDQGLGTALLHRAIVIARNRAAKSIYMLCLIDNPRMLHIAAKCDGVLQLYGGQAEADLLLPYPTQLSLLEEAAGDGAGYLGRAYEQIRAGALPRWDWPAFSPAH